MCVQMSFVLFHWYPAGGLRVVSVFHLLNQVLVQRCSLRVLTQVRAKERRSGRLENCDNCATFQSSGGLWDSEVGFTGLSEDPHLFLSLLRLD